MSQTKLIELRSEVAELEHLSREINAIFAPLLAKEMKAYRRRRARMKNRECVKQITLVFFEESQRLEKIKTRSLGKITKRLLEKKVALLKLERTLPTSKAIVPRLSRQERINRREMSTRTVYNNQLFSMLEDQRDARAEKKAEKRYNLAIDGSLKNV